MIEWLIPPALLLGAALIPKRKMPDEKKIEEVFKSRNIGIKKSDETKYPKLIEKNDNKFYTTYLYSLPLGLPSDYVDTVIPAIKEALNKEIETDFDGGLYKIRVYKNELPEKWSYTEDLLRPGTWEIPIGRNHQGVIYHNFDRYAHFLIGGVPGFGKTILTKVMFYSLIRNQPEDVKIYILDLKGGLEFFKFRGFPQVKKVASDLEEAAETLLEIVQEMKKSEEVFRREGYTNIVETDIKERTFVFVDEGAELSPDIVYGDAKQYARFCQAALSEIARIGRAVGYRLIYSTQYPSAKSVDMSIKMNIVSRVSFVAASQVSSRVILDESGAEELPSIPGRAIYKVEKMRMIQVPYIDDNYIFNNLRQDVFPEKK